MEHRLPSHAGQVTHTLLAVSSQFDTHYEINPRIPGDISPA